MQQTLRANRSQSICIFESIGGSDKGESGNRPDSEAIISALQEKGWACSVVKYDPELQEIVYQSVVGRYCAYIGRILVGQTYEHQFYAFLRRLSRQLGMVGIIDPDSMDRFGRKQVLHKLKPTGLTPTDTLLYSSQQQLKINLPLSLNKAPRVLKSNLGSIGQGVWKVQLLDKDSKTNLSSKVRCVEAADNHCQILTLQDFCDKYRTTPESQLSSKVIDMPYLPSITKGEIRVVLVGSEPVFVIHKQPFKSQQRFSTNSKYAGKTYHDPEQFPDLMRLIKTKQPHILDILEQQDFPLIWTADFIPADQPHQQGYYLSEINCTCISIETHLSQGVQEKVASQIIRRIQRRS